MEPKSSCFFCYSGFKSELKIQIKTWWNQEFVERLELPSAAHKNINISKSQQHKMKNFTFVFKQFLYLDCVIRMNRKKVKYLRRLGSRVIFNWDKRKLKWVEEVEDETWGQDDVRKLLKSLWQIRQMTGLFQTRERENVIFPFVHQDGRWPARNFTQWRLISELNKWVIHILRM